MINRYRYTKITAWARARYATVDGVLTDIGGIASRYSVIEHLAAERYMGCTIRTRPACTFPPLFDAPAFGPGLVEVQSRRFSSRARAAQWCRQVGRLDLIASIHDTENAAE